MLHFEVSFYVEITIHERSLLGMTFDRIDRLIELLHEEGAVETCHYADIVVSFDHGSERQARDTVLRAFKRLKQEPPLSAGG